MENHADDSDFYPAEQSKLSYAEEMFCAEFVRTGNRNLAYQYSFGKSSPLQASLLLDKEIIIEKINHIRKVVSETINFTIIDHMMNLAMIRDMSIRQGDLKTALASEKCRGEVMGFYKGKVADAQNIQIHVDTLPPLISDYVDESENIKRLDS